MVIMRVGGSTARVMLRVDGYVLIVCCMHAMLYSYTYMMVYGYVVCCMAYASVSTYNLYISPFSMYTPGGSTPRSR